MSDKRSEDHKPADDFDPNSPETFASAHALYADMRQKCPVAHSSAWNGFWALLRYEDVVAVLKDVETFTTTVQNVVPKVAFTGRRPPLHLDPPEHTPYRRAINPFFSDEKMTKIEPAVRRITISLLEPLLKAGGGDICAEYSHKLPGHVFAEFFNLPTDLSMAIKEVTALYDQALQSFDNEEVKQTSLQLYEIARRIIAMRKAQPMDPADDPTSALLDAKYNGEPLPEDMVLGTIRQFIVVGMIAPSVFIGSMTVHLAEHPELQQQLRSDPALVPAAVEEYLRLLTPYRGFARTARHDVEIGGRRIKKDEPIALVYASANRDESIFPNGDQFILNRANIKQHVAFGLGPHQCAGIPLARLMLRVTLEEFLSRTRSIVLDGEVKMTRWPEWGTLAVPIRVVRREY
jgi:cytochrome P450